MAEEKLSYLDAVNVALRRALEERPEVLVFGEDVGTPGGVFGATKGLQATFGRRVFDTPISESAILGAAVGSAMLGRRPVVEIMWIDFALVAFDQLVNQAANVRYVSEGRLQAPLTVRTQMGAAPGSCAQHSQNLEAFLAHVPGLRVCVPGTAQDAHDLLLSSIWDDDPCIVIENRTLYTGPKDLVETGGPIAPVGGARTVREGSDVLIVSWGKTVRAAVDAADDLERDGISAEVIDLRWLAPFDEDAVAASVERTGRLVVAHEANRTGGFGAEVVSRAVERCFFALDAPPARVALGDLRVPSAPHLQAAVLPDAAAIAAAVRSLP